MTTEQLLLRLSDMDILSGDEASSGLDRLIADELCLDEASLRYDTLGNLLISLSEGDGGKHILLEAHADEIGLIVTDIESDGTLRFATVGGVAPGNLLGSRFRVYGEKGTYTAVTVTAPPHLIGADADAIPEIRDLRLDVGMTAEEAREVIRPGDRILRKQSAVRLGDFRVTGKALDDRAGVAVLLEAAKRIQKAGTRHKITLALTSQEEVGCRGAAAVGTVLSPDEAICVDVSFATQPGVSGDEAGKLGKGPMLGISPILSRSIWEKLHRLADQKDIPCQMEVMGGRTGTNADVLTIAGTGIPCGLVSIPQRNMHTDVEVVDLRDVDNAATLLAAYCTEDETLGKEATAI